MIKETQKSLLIIAIIGFLIYFNSLFNGFVWDDEEQILTNRVVHSLTNLPTFFQGSTFNSGGSGNLGGLYYKPLMTVFFSFLYSLFGPSAFIFHLFQLSIHILNSILVFLIFKHFIKTEPNDQLLKRNLAFILALVFLVHPINTETVVYISSLQDILFFFFGSLSFWLLIKRKVHSFLTLFISSLLLLLSLLSKETGFIFLLITIVYTLFYAKKNLKKIFTSVFSVLSFYSVLRFLVAGVFFNKHELSPITTISFWERLINIPQIFFYYLKTFLFPKDLIISQQWVVKTLNFQDFIFPLLIAVSFLGTLIGLGFYLFKKARQHFYIYSFFFLWFTLSLGLHLQIFPLDMTVAERWFYMPIVGLLGMMGIAIQELKIKNEAFKIITIGLIVIIISLLSIRTFVRNFDWKDGLTLYSHDIKYSKESFDLENNLGVELFRAKRYSEAKIHYENSTLLAPQWWTNWNNLGVIAEMDGNKDKAKEYYQKAIDNGNYYLAYENLAKLLTFNESPEISKQFIESSLQRLPLNANLWLFLSLSQYKANNISDAKKAAKNSYFLSPSQENYYVYSRLEQNLPLDFKNNVQ